MTKNLECEVFDLCAAGSPRVHELRLPDGSLKKYTFTDKYDGVKMPYDVAKTLIGNDGFEVKDSSGHILKPLPNHARGEVTELRIDECVANFDELTREALLERCAKHGKKFSNKDNKPAIIEFLVARNIGAVNAGGGSAFEDIEAEGTDLLEEEDAY